MCPLQCIASYNVYHFKNRASQKKIKQLLLMDGTKNHYCLIKNFSNLIHKLNRSSKKRTKGSKSRFCRNCFKPVIRESYGNYMEKLYPSVVGKKHKGALCCLRRLGSNRCPCTSYSYIPSNTTEIERQYPTSFGAVLFDQQKCPLVKKVFYKGPDCFDQLMESVRDWLLRAYSQKQKHRILKISGVQR